MVRRGSRLDFRDVPLAPGRDGDAPDMARAFAGARAALAFGAEVGIGRLTLDARGRHPLAARAWVRAGVLPVGSWAGLDRQTRMNLDGLIRMRRINGRQADLVKGLLWAGHGQPGLARCLSALPNPVAGHRGPVLGRAVLRDTAWLGEIDLDEPASRRMFEGLCGGTRAWRRTAEEAAEASGRAALERSGFDAGAIASVYGRR